MEARQTLRGGAVPKGLIVLLAICATVALAVAGSVVSKNLAASSATRSVIVHPAAGTVLRQDAGTAPALLDRGAEGQASQAAPVGIRNGRSSGNQSIVDNAAGQAANQPSSLPLTAARSREGPSRSLSFGFPRIAEDASSRRRSPPVFPG